MAWYGMINALTQIYDECSLTSKNKHVCLFVHVWYVYVNKAAAKMCTSICDKVSSLSGFVTHLTYEISNGHEDEQQSHKSRRTANQ